MRLLVLIFTFLTLSCEQKKAEEKIECGFDYTITNKSTSGVSNDDIKYDLIVNTHVGNRDGLTKLFNEIIKLYPEYDKYNSFNFNISAFNSRGEFVKTIFTQYKISRQKNGRTIDINTIIGQDKFVDSEGNIWVEHFIGLDK